VVEPDAINRQTENDRAGPFNNDSIGPSIRYGQ